MKKEIIKRIQQAIRKKNVIVASGINERYADTLMVTSHPKGSPSNTHTFAYIVRNANTLWGSGDYTAISTDYYERAKEMQARKAAIRAYLAIIKDYGIDFYILNSLSGNTQFVALENERCYYIVPQPECSEHFFRERRTK